MNKVILLLLISAVLAGSPPSDGADATARPKLLVTTTLIETAVRDLMGPDADVLRLMPPGSCPGHFDLEPGQVAAMASADLFIRHDYQAGLDSGVLKTGLAADRIVCLTSFPSFVIPGNYAALCGELRDRLVLEWPDRADGINDRLGQIRRNAADVTENVRARAGSTQGRKALCAHYQKDFCEWIGLDVVASFHAGADESAWQLNRAVEMGRTAGAEAVVGNRQWGPRHLAAMTEAAGLPGVMLSNFPDSGEAGAYWPFVESNVTALLKGFEDAGH